MSGLNDTKEQSISINLGKLLFYLALEINLVKKIHHHHCQQQQDSFLFGEVFCVVSMISEGFLIQEVELETEWWPLATLPFLNWSLHVKSSIYKLYVRGVICVLKVHIVIVVFTTLNTQMFNRSSSHWDVFPIKYF